MNEDMTKIALKFDDFKEKGLYLIFPDGSRIVLTKKNIEETASKFWNTPEKISESTKKATHFQRCSFCYLKNQADMCDAIRPTIPLLEALDKYVSFEHVVAVFKGDDEALQVSQTTMQNALKFVSMLGLMSYCQKGRSYWKYFYGINPVMNPTAFASQVYLNIFFLNKGDKDSTASAIKRFSDDITITTQNQVERMRLICKNDAFLSAFVITQTATLFLSLDMEAFLNEAIQKFGENYSRISPH